MTSFSFGSRNLADWPQQPAVVAANGISLLHSVYTVQVGWFEQEVRHDHRDLCRSAKPFWATVGTILREPVGTITYESEEGSGTTFHVALPSAGDQSQKVYAEHK